MSAPARPQPVLILVPRRGRWAMFISVVFIVAPALAFADDEHGVRLAVGLALAAVFAVLYFAVMVGAWHPIRGMEEGRSAVLSVVALGALAAGLTALGGTTWTGLWCFVGAATGLRIDRERAVPALVVLSCVAAGVELVGGHDGGAAASLFLVTLGVGMLTGGFRRLHQVNRELGAARGEIGRLAVADERLRFARDLHDLLGHSLSVVALKSELAQRLLPQQPEQAAEQVRDIEAVSRRALAEVREAVAAYRRPVLAAELAGARTTLRAAGIAVEADPLPDAELPPDAEAVLAWTVREGTTNVLRHADARHVRIRMVVDGRDAALEVVDDGCGGRGPARDGTGLAGLAERVARVRGRLEAAPDGPGGGFRLAVSVPLEAAA